MQPDKNAKSTQLLSFGPVQPVLRAKICNWLAALSAGWLGLQRASFKFVNKNQIRGGSPKLQVQDKYVESKVGLW